MTRVLMLMINFCGVTLGMNSLEEAVENVLEDLVDADNDFWHHNYREVFNTTRQMAKLYYER